MTNKYDLHFVEWGEFQIGKEFIIESTASGIDRNKLTVGDGKYPYITRTDNNNGIDGYIRVQDKYQINTGNVISIGLDTQTVFYQSASFYTGQNLQILTHKRLNRYTAQFLIPLFKTQLNKFSWGSNGATLGRLRKTKILLPKDSSGKPDWDFMEGYMREKEKQQLKTALSYYKKKNGDNNAQEMSLKKCEWKAFEIDYICDIRSGTRLTKTSMKTGNKPFIGATDSHNGITNFVSNTNGSEDSNVLGVNYNGSVVENFYHPYVCIFSDDVKRFKLKNTAGNQDKYLFLKRMILNQKNKYQYAYKFNGSRMKKQKILLPANSKGEPDWDFIEQYMQYQEQKLVKKYIDFAKGRLALSE